MTQARPRAGFRSFVRGGLRRKESAEVAVGDRFEELADDLPVWVVRRISCVSTSVYPLVSLYREGRPELERTLSIAALEDSMSYRRAPGLTAV